MYHFFSDLTFRTGGSAQEVGTDLAREDSSYQVGGLSTTCHGSYEINSRSRLMNMIFSQPSPFSTCVSSQTAVVLSLFMCSGQQSEIRWRASPIVGLEMS